VLAKYTKSYLESALTMTATISIAAYCLWAFEGTGLISRAHGRETWIHLTAVPVVLGALYVLRVLDAGEGGAPEDLVYGDRMLQGLGLLWIAFAVIGIYG
jgi:decaprenyl-phosphate phosphoribosyltransferase